MSATGRILTRCFVLLLSALIVSAVSASRNSFSLDAKKQEAATAGKASAAVRDKKSSAYCRKSVTHAQLAAIAAKLREFQAKQQSKQDRGREKKADQASTRNP